MRGRLLTLLLVGITAGCHDTRGAEALLALVKLHEAQAANCIVLEVLTPEGTVLHSERVARSPNKQELRIALYREQLPEEVELQARPLWNANCKAPTQQDLPNGPVSVRVRARFIQEGGRAELVLGPPENDTDEDGFADRADGGPDCVDSRSDTNPAAAEVCDAIEDRNCDAQRGCNDTTCAPSECVPVPSHLAFTQWKDAAEHGACTGPFTVTRQDAQARASTIAETLTVTLQGATAEFYSDAGCATAPSALLLLDKGQSSASFYLRGQALGTLNVTASHPKLATATGALQVVTGPAAKLVFINQPRTASAGSCSEPLTLERRDARDNIVTEAADLDINLFLSPQGQFEFFTDEGCATPVPAVRIPRGQSSTTFRFRGTQVGSFTLTASSSLPAVQQNLSVTLGTPVTVKFTPSAQTLLGGTCSSMLEVSATDPHGNPLLTSAQVTLTSTPPVTFYSDANCQTQLSAPPSLSSSTGKLRFYFKGTASGPTTLTATTQNLGQAQQVHTVRAQVTTGQCQLSTTGPGATQVECPISPPLFNPGRTFLLFQATSAADSPATALVRCYLADASRILCDRRSEGPAVDIQWQTAEFASGVQVRHLLSEVCTGTTTSITLAPPVQNLNESFVLSSFSQDGDNVDSNDAFTVELAAADRVDITSDGGCSVPKWALQVVEFPGARVDRGTTSISNGNYSGSATNLFDVDLARSVVLHTFRAPVSDALICNRLLRGELNGTDGVRFIRGGNSGTCNDVAIPEIAWERIQFPNGYSVQEKDVTINAGLASGKVSVTTVNPNRTLVFSGGQSFSGQSSGETTFATTDIVGAGVGRHRLISSGAELEVVRGHSVGSATFTSYVLQLP